MKYSQLLLPTLKEVPADAEIISHQLMLRGGLIRKLAGGIYTWLPLGLRIIRKIERIVRQEMNRAGAQEIFMPAVQPAELWQESGRWEFYGKELLRFKDRHQNDYCFGPTHEEVVTDLIRREVQSYRDLPLNLYQVQTKFRDEIRPRFGVMRSREFIMKDAYSFDVDDDGASVSYKAMHAAYTAIFKRLGLEFSVVEADSGAIGGSYSHEFMVLAATGEDAVISCTSCDYAANLEKAETKTDIAPPAEPTESIKEVATPETHNVPLLAEFLKVPTRAIAKNLIYLADGKPVAALLRGDRELNEIKFKNVLQATDLVLAAPSAVLELTGAPVGFAGPLSLNMPIYADRELLAESSLIIGANQKDLHYTGFNLTRDLPKATIHDLRLAAPGDPCPRCGKQAIFARGIEVGHIFKLGTKYSEAMKAEFLDAQGNSRSIIMGCYGIGITRIVAAAIEQGNDENGMIFPQALAPFSLTILPMALTGPAWEKALELYNEFWMAGIDVLLDDRDLRPGVKFKDADLLGIPLRLVVGPKGLESGQVELKHRKSGEVEMLPLTIAVSKITDMVKSAGGGDVI